MAEVWGATHSKMQWRIREIKRVLKQNIILQPTSGAVQVNSGQKVIVDLPFNSLVDLSTFAMNFTAWTDHAGNVVGGATGYVRTRFFPRNIASLIQNFEIKINGKSIVNVPEYNYIYNILHDFTQGQDGLNRRAIGENADPSCKYMNNAGVITPRRGYPVGIETPGAINESQNDKDSYTIRSWLSMLGGNASTNIIDTSILGLVTIEITLAPSAITMLGRANAGAAIAAVTVANSEVGLAVVAGAAIAGGGATAAQGNSYHLGDVKFSMVRYDMPAEYYDSVRNVLDSGAAYKLYYPNYSVFTGAPVNSLSKNTTVRMSLSTSSLDYVIGTFRAANYDDNLDATNTPVISNTSTLASGMFGQNITTFDSQAKNGQAILFNNSKYLVRNGESLDYATWTIGNTRGAPENPTEIFEGVLRHFNIQNDVLGGIHPSIKSIPQFNKYSFAHILSLNIPGETDMYTVSGLNTEEIPVNIAWETKSNTAFIADGTWGINAGGGVTCLPVLIAGYSSHIQINKNRNITVVN